MTNCVNSDRNFRETMASSAHGSSHVERTSHCALRTDVAPRTSHLALLSVCPICFDATGSLTAGARAGALTLVIVTVVVIAGFVRFAWRLR